MQEQKRWTKRDTHSNEHTHGYILIRHRLREKYVYRSCTSETYSQWEYHDSRWFNVNVSRRRRFRKSKSLWLTRNSYLTHESPIYLTTYKTLTSNTRLQGGVPQKQMITPEKPKRTKPKIRWSSKEHRETMRKAVEAVLVNGNTTKVAQRFNIPART